MANWYAVATDANWNAVATDYKYLNRDPDPLVTPVTVHWECTSTDGVLTGRVYGSNSIGEDQPEFAESQMVRVTESVMLDWLHQHQGAEWVAETEAAADAALLALQEPATGTTPPDDA